MDRNVSRTGAPQAPLRVMVLDDHGPSRGQFLSHLAGQPGIRVVADVVDVAEAMRHARTANPDVVLVSARLAGAVDPHAIGRLRAAMPAAEVLMLSASEDAAGVAAGMRAGASGYVLRGLDAELLADALRRAGRDAAGNGSGNGGGNGGGNGSELHGERLPPDAPLSPRQLEILGLVAEGWSNKEIARMLGVAESTVKIHVQHILRKLGLTSRVQAAVYATARVNRA